MVKVNYKQFWHDPVLQQGLYVNSVHLFFPHPFLKISYSRTFSVTKDTYLLCTMQEKLIWVTCNYIAISWGRAVSASHPSPDRLCAMLRFSMTKWQSKQKLPRGLVTSDQHWDGVSPVQDGILGPDSSPSLFLGKAHVILVTSLV